MCRQRCLDLGLLKEVRRGMPLYRLKPPQVREWDDRGGFATQLDDLAGPGSLAADAVMAPRYRDRPTSTPSHSHRCAVAPGALRKQEA